MSKNPEIKRHRTVYFNLDEPNDAALNNYIESLGVKFSGYVKGLIFQDQLNRSQGVPVNPYQMSQAYVMTRDGIQIPIQQESYAPPTPSSNPAKVQSSNNTVVVDEELPPIKVEEPKVEEPEVVQEQKAPENENKDEKDDDLSSVESRQAAQIQNFVRTRPNRNRK